MRPPVAANGCPAASEEPVTLSLVAVDGSERGVEAEPLPAEVLVLPGRQRREHGRGERLVDLVQVEVLQGQALAREHPRDGVCGGHEQPLVARDVVDRGGLAVDEPGEGLQAVRRRPLLGAEQHGRGAVGERRGVAGRHRRVLAAAEDGAQGGELLEGRVGAQVLVAGEPEVGGHEVVEESPLVGGGEPVVTGEGELVLSLAGDAPALGGDGHVLPHRHARAGLGVGRHLDAEVGRADRQRGPGAVGGGLGAREPEQLLPQLLGDDDGRVRGGVDAAGDAGVDLSEARSCWRRGSRPRARCRTPAGRRRRGCRGPGCEPRTASRVRLKSRLCLMTAPATTSPSRSPASPWRATRPSSAAVSMSWLEASAYGPN